MSLLRKLYVISIQFVISPEIVLVPCIRCILNSLLVTRAHHAHCNYGLRIMQIAHFGISNRCLKISKKYDKNFDFHKFRQLQMCSHIFVMVMMVGIGIYSDVCGKMRVKGDCHERCTYRTPSYLLWLSSSSSSYMGFTIPAMVLGASCIPFKPLDLATIY